MLFAPQRGHAPVSAPFNVAAGGEGSVTSPHPYPWVGAPQPPQT